MADAASPTDFAPAANGAGHWQHALQWIDVGGDAVIALACAAVAALLVRAMRQRPDLPRSSLLALTVLLSMLGAAHVLAFWNVGHVPPWLPIGTKYAAAMAGLISAACAWRELRQLVALPTHAQLASAQAELQRSHAELESFMSSVSHDLRSPLTTIAGQAGLLELSLGKHASDDLKRRVQRIHHSVRHMSQLIEALLALSRITRHELCREPLDLSALARQVIDELAHKEPQRAVAVTIQPELRAHGDRRLVTDLFGHVLGNAWKFTARTPQARIEIGAVQQGNTLALYVRDNGAGFDMAYESKLFKPFQRLHAPSEFEGAGIGLASAARIVARHGGKIWVQAAPNTGATFYFTLSAA